MKTRAQPYQYRAVLRSTRRLLPGLIFLILCAPYICNIILYRGWPDGSIAESSIFAMAKSQYFHDFWRYGSVFNQGQESVFPLNYAIFYGLWSLLQVAFGDTASYLILLIAFLLVGYASFIKLFLSVPIERRHVTTSVVTSACLMGLAYFSSLAIFNYLKSNVFFTLPYYILPTLLLCSLKYLRDGSKRWLFLFFAASYTLADFNTAHVGILCLFINVFLVIVRPRGLSPAQFVRRLTAVNIMLAPALLLLLAVVLGNVAYTGSLTKFTRVAAENMYSINADYLNIFTQLTDWGLFGSWNGALYYDFSPFYAGFAIRLLGIAPYLLLAFGLATAPKAQAGRRMALHFLVVLVVVVELMRGNNDPIYHFLYTHVVAFQIFRNITKLAPLLFLLTLLVSFILLQPRLRKRKLLLVTTALLLLSVGYNIPYWTYSGYYFRYRAVQDIPGYWHRAAAFINSSASDDSKILMLPAIYVNDAYDWDGRQAWVQGSLGDMLFRPHSYRLSECCIGSPDFQADAKELFVPSERSVRRLDVSYSKLSAFVAKYHLDYVVLSDDLLSEYQRSSDIRSWLRRDGYEHVAQYGPVGIYQDAKLREARIAGGPLVYRKYGHLRLRLNVRHLKNRRVIHISAPFNRGWAAYVIPQQKSLCRFPVGVIKGESATSCRHSSTAIPTLMDLRAFWGSRAVIAPHKVAQDDGNSWTLDPELIRSRVPSPWYSRNGDGSINVSVLLLFRPQIETYLIVGLSAALSVAILLWFALQLLVRRRAAH